MFSDLPSLVLSTTVVYRSFEARCNRVVREACARFSVLCSADSVKASLS